LRNRTALRAARHASGNLLRAPCDRAGL
jgi:hypothetical protein